jgi:hypothetical protein
MAEKIQSFDYAQAVAELEQIAQKVEDPAVGVDDIDKYICFTMRVIEAYTNLELSEDLEADYDLLCESGLLDIVIATFKKEYDEVNILLQMRCEYILSNNNIEAQVGKFLDGLFDKIDVISDALANKIGDFSMDKLPINESDLNKLLDFIDKSKLLEFINKK